VSHGGSWAGYRAELLRFPRERLAVACLCNLGSTNPSDLAERVAEVYLEGRMTPKETPAPADFVTLPESELHSRVGVYWDRLSDDYLFLSAKEGSLVLERGGSSAPFWPLSATRFASESSPSIEISFEGEALDFKRRDETQSFSRIEPWKPTPRGLRDFSGRYRSEEITAPIEVGVQDGNLVLQHRTIARDPMKPTRPDSFYLDGLSLSFTRDGAGNVDGFTLGMGRVKGLVYAKER
jgi:hypothetical protein